MGEFGGCAHVWFWAHLSFSMCSVFATYRQHAAQAAVYTRARTHIRTDDIKTKSPWIQQQSSSMHRQSSHPGTTSVERWHNWCPCLAWKKKKKCTAEPAEGACSILSSADVLVGWRVVFIAASVAVASPIFKCIWEQTAVAVQQPFRKKGAFWMRLWIINREAKRKWVLYRNTVYY